MPVAAFTDEFAFQSYLIETIGPAIRADLGMSTASLQMAMQDALLDVGVTDIAQITDTRKLRAWGKLRAWEWVANQYAVESKTSVDGQSLDLQQKFDHAKVMLAAARAEVDAIVALDLTATEAEGSFDWAEVVTGPFSRRERLADEYQRGSF